MMRWGCFILCHAIATLVAVAETRVRIEGSTARGEGGLLGDLGGRLAHVRASPASPPLADDAAYMLRELLVRDGHANARVTWRISGRDEIVLLVDEGKRAYIGRITVKGVPDEDVKKLVSIYQKPARGDRGIGMRGTPFREADVDSGVALVRQELNARGYWDAEVGVAGRKADPVTGAVDLELKVRMGEKFRILKPVVSCPDFEIMALASNAASVYQNRGATTANLNAMRLEVETAVKAKGYPGAEIRMERVLQGAGFAPRFDITLGKRVRLHKVSVSGLEKTQPHRITNRFKPLIGEWYDETVFNKKVSLLLATGAFSSARVEKTETGEGELDVALRFEEAKAREFSAGLGFGSYQGVITQMTYSDRNLFGDLLGFSAGMELGSRGILGDVRLTDPWVFTMDLANTARLYALVYAREGYQTFDTGFEDKLVWKYGKHYGLELLGGYSVVNVTAEELPEYALGETSYTRPRVRITQSLDFRDNPVLPKSGWHLSQYVEAGAALGDVDTSYVMAGLSGGWHYAINRKYELGVGGDLAFIHPSGGFDDLPIDLRLFNGGSRSVRGFPEREMGYRVNGYAVGGESAWSANVELIRNIHDSVKLVGFVDAGSISGGNLDFSEAGVDVAAGLGIRFDLPIGPVRFEYGCNLARDKGEPSGAFHFAIGVAY